MLTIGQEVATSTPNMEKEVLIFGDKVKLIITVLVVLASIGAWTVYDLIKKAVQLLRGQGSHFGLMVVAGTRTVAVQGPTTYTALRGVSHPRFQPLPDYAWGVFAG